MKLREGLDGHCPVKKISVMPPECRQPKLYRVWRRPHGGCQRKHPNASAAEQYQRKGEQLKEGTHPSRPADPCETERFVKGPVANGTIQETETPSQKQGESTESSTMVPESHKLSVRFSPNVSLASLPSAARTPSIPRGSLSHSQKLQCNEWISKRNLKVERELFAKTVWSPWKAVSSLADSPVHHVQDVKSASKRSTGSPEGKNSSKSLEPATIQTGASSGAA
ncbi:hypothetical protein EAH_00014050 [Eimeria acervulina]|uniref:Uncharacterized protein n=1 Tax=Eimeria acervulina TaxID=5801 RepID=U6GIY1_EIMAC|nr:hypothetical protein EAH_00014050 [Eimeria acervulina]CDI80206.1 hypothetical protein EAH_00014050 [Eimeria acervulina]